MTWEREVCKELGEEIGTVRLEEEDINQMQPETRLLNSGMREILFKKVLEQVGIIGTIHKSMTVPLAWR